MVNNKDLSRRKREQERVNERERVSERDTHTQRTVGKLTALHAVNLGSILISPDNFPSISRNDS